MAKMSDIDSSIFALSHPLSSAEALALMPMSLAFVGDGVQSLYVRTRVTVGSSAKTGTLHKEVTKVVKAVSQADAVEKLLPQFDAVEGDVFRRARNSRILTSAKHADIAQYRYASGFEAVIGYLYLTGQTERLSLFLDTAYVSEADADAEHKSTANSQSVPCGAPHDGYSHDGAPLNSAPNSDISHTGFGGKEQ